MGKFTLTITELDQKKDKVVVNSEKISPLKVVALLEVEKARIIAEILVSSTRKPSSEKKK